MKLDIRMEQGRPIIFWTDDPDATQHTVTCYTLHDGHNSSSRAYMRGLPKPQTAEDFDRVMSTLAAWAQTPNR